MRPREGTGAGRLIQKAVAGLLVFTAGAALALFLLPEWSRGDFPPERFFQSQYRLLVARTSLRLAAGEPRVYLRADLTRPPGQKPAVRLRAAVSHAVRSPGESPGQRLRISFSPDGRPVEVIWENPSASPLSASALAHHERVSRELSPLLLASGESLGKSREDWSAGMATRRSVDLMGSSPGQHLSIEHSPPMMFLAERQMGSLAEAPAPHGLNLGKNLATALIYGLIALAVAGIFLSLLVHGRIDLTNGAILALITFLSVDLSRFSQVFDRLTSTVLFGFVLAVFTRAIAVFLAWSAGESLLRSLRPDFTTSLDTLRRGQLGPRAGRALLLGFSFGATLAGLRLGIHALATRLPGVAPAEASLELPVFDLTNSPVGTGILMAALTTLMLALALRFLPARRAAWAVPAAALLAGYVLSPVQITPFPVELACNAVLVGLLVWVGKQHGLTALLAASLVAALLPAALFSALHLSWLPVSFALTAVPSAALLILGFAGLSRPEETETETVPPPAFMRRLAHERRIQHEVDLLARMQVGLLPREMPRVEGYEIAARSVLASEAGGDLYDFLRDEAGGLWIAAGDVAGHGYSCAVAQAMVKAGLLSLVAPGESPAGVLHQLDRVLRGVSTDHSFTSLALISLDPAKGSAVLANAGYPYPLVYASGRVSEIDLPGRPLGAGRGVSRPYEDRAFELPRGGALLLCSDGLFEALDRNGNAYGFDRAREVLQAMGHRPIIEIMDALLNDCRRHLGAETPPDDVTVVVVKRG